MAVLTVGGRAGSEQSGAQARCACCQNSLFQERPPIGKLLERTSGCSHLTSPSLQRAQYFDFDWPLGSKIPLFLFPAKAPSVTRFFNRPWASSLCRLLLATDQRSRSHPGLGSPEH